MDTGESTDTGEAIPGTVQWVFELGFQAIERENQM